LLIDKLDNLADAVSRVEAQLSRLQTLGEAVAALKKEINKQRHRSGKEINTLCTYILGFLCTNYEQRITSLLRAHEHCNYTP